MKQVVICAFLITLAHNFAWPGEKINSDPFSGSAGSSIDWMLYSSLGTEGYRVSSHNQSGLSYRASSFQGATLRYKDQIKFHSGLNTELVKTPQLSERLGHPLSLGMAGSYAIFKNYLNVTLGFHFPLGTIQANPDDSIAVYHLLNSAHPVTERNILPVKWGMGGSFFRVPAGRVEWLGGVYLMRPGGTYELYPGESKKAGGFFVATAGMKIKSSALHTLEFKGVFPDEEAEANGSPAFKAGAILRTSYTYKKNGKTGGWIGGAGGRYQMADRYRRFIISNELVENDNNNLQTAYVLGGWFFPQWKNSLIGMQLLPRLLYRQYQDQNLSAGLGYRIDFNLMTKFLISGRHGLKINARITTGQMAESFQGGAIGFQYSFFSVNNHKPWLFPPRKVNQ